MKFCQDKRKNKIIVLFIFIILLFGLFFNNAKADWGDLINSMEIDSSLSSVSGGGAEIRKGITCKVPNGDLEQAKEAVNEQIKSKLGMTAIYTIDMLVAGKLEKINCTDTRGIIERALDQITTWAREDLWKELMASTAVAYKAALKNFLNTLAYDMATYLATGDKGQLPMFETEGWGGYLKNVADNTAGAFIEGLGKGMPTLKFNLCRPNSDVMLKIELGLGRQFRPKAPACSFSQLRDNWEAALNDKDFLPKFQDMFNPWSNDLGIALTLQTGIESEISRAVNEAAQDRLEGQGFKSVRDFISEKIKTPSAVVREATQKTFGDSDKNLFVYTGNAIADSIDVFINTLIGKLIDKWLRDGLVTDFPPLLNRLDSLTDPNSPGRNSLTDPNAQRLDEGIAGAEGRFKTLIEPNFKVRGDYDILAKLTVCPDPTKAGPTDCVIEEKFREAIEKRLTVGQALKQGYLSNTLFGFLAAGSKRKDTPEPMFNEGYPYRSMLILRKFRIIPVGWEIAAQRINEGKSADGQGPASAHTLGDLVACFSNDDNDEEDWGVENYKENWCAGLVDPNWVLKAPQNFCGKEGPGPEILSEQVSGEGAGSSLSVLRNDNYCADERSVVTERSDGSNVYGYCTEERRKWDFNGKDCAPRNNTCQTFSSANGQTVSYLQNTLYFGVCGPGNVGCAKYAANGSYNAASKTVVWDGDKDPVYLNRSAQSCDAADEGCHGFIRITPNKDETFASIEGNNTREDIDKAYQRFFPGGLIHEKLLPDYLVDKKADGSREDYDKGACYDEQGRPRTLAPAICSNFVRQCQKQEVGCELYTSVTDGAKIPAKVDPIDDYCPAACVGYDGFIQQATTFTSSRQDYFIPKTAKTCSAENSGCEQFTNLDEVKKGGEGVEYYTYLRQCLAKAANAENCGEFYSWEGSDESGYQLKVESLAVKGAEPKVTEDDSDLCDKRIYNLPLSDPAHNPDCREFYNRAGEPFYHLYKRTISCSDNCHPYRKTAADDGSCQGGGDWDKAKKACIYMAIPGQGATCPAAENGCREYTGNTGNDLRNIFTDDFEAVPTLGDWLDANGLTVGIEPTNVSLALQSNLGHSMLVKVNNSQAVAKRTVGNAVREGKAYVLSFLIKADADTTLKIFLATSTSGAKAEFTDALIDVPDTGPTWQIKKTNLANLAHKPTADEFLQVSANQNFYIDSLTLTEIVDRYYLIKDSWQDSCNYRDADTSKDEVGDAYYAGCDQYQDRASQTHNLFQFSELCSEAAVGCELMIDTKNSTSTAEETFSRDGTTKTVPADEFTYVVYDQDKLCSQEAKGCSLLGKSYKYENEPALYGDIYLKNNPDNYRTILCGADAVGCEAFAYDDGVKSGEKYFKDPGDQVCEWRQELATTTSPQWFKKKVKRCGGDNGAVCLSDKDCVGGVKCQTETIDKECPLDTDGDKLAKTLGRGGAGGQVSQPAGNGWAGVCAAANSGCGEYIDPVSRFNANIIFNGGFQNLDNNTKTVDGWIFSKNNNIANQRKFYEQNVTLEPNTVYRLARLERDKLLPDGLTISCPAGTELYGITGSNTLAGPKNATSTPAENYANSRIFYYHGNNRVDCAIIVDKLEKNGFDGAVELKPAIIDYQLAQNLDKKSCNGVPDFNKGCVLFNERSQEGANLLELKWDADTEKIIGNINDQDKDSNTILKVAPDRVCDKWLACKSKIKDEKGNDVCYNLALCNAMDDKGDCLSFINSPKTNQILGADPGQLGADKISNLSGYAKAGLVGGSLGGDYYPLGAMEQKGEVADLANGGFEFYGSNGYPIGWLWGGGGAAKSWDANIFSVINNPIAAQVEGIGYAREGRAFLKLGSSYDATSEETDVLPNTDYVITAYSNTKNLKSGEAKIDIVNSAGAAIKSEVMTQALGNDWEFKVGKFKSGNNSTIKIKLYSSAGGTASSEGNFYFDDVKIRPALESKCKDNCADKNDYDPYYTAQSCRLYPQTDSLACDYYEDSGKRQKGWPGYCLEYDRWPGNPNTCLLWYPVDRVKGDGLEEGRGYRGKFPVYYCLEAEPPQTLNGQCSAKFPTGTEQEIILDDPYMVVDQAKAKIILREMGGLNTSKYGLSLRNYFDQRWTGMVEGKQSGPSEKMNSKDRDRVWDLSTDFEQIKMFDAVKITCIWGDYTVGDPPPHRPGWDNCECYDFKSETGIMNAARCNTITQTVDAVGQNKFWSSRVYQGSDYSFSRPLCNANIPYATSTCSYGSDQTPFGSIVPPANSLSALYNPYEWDTKLAPGKQPIYYEFNRGQARMGQELSEASTKQIFAKTYGTWGWDKQVCQGGVNAGKSCIGDYSCQGACNSYVCVNNNTGNTTSRCQGGVNDGKACLSATGADFCNNSCPNYNSGAGSCVNNICLAGNKKNEPCRFNNICQADKRGIKTCLGGNKDGKYCSNNADCDDCRGCAGKTYGTCESSFCEVESTDTVSPTTSCRSLDKGVCQPVPLTNICLGGNKNLLSCNTIGSNECKGCAGQTFGQCQQFRYCQGGPRDQQTCPASGGAAFCNNSCSGFNIGSCDTTTLKCVGGNKAGNSCTINTCEADSFGIKICVGGSKAGKYCSGNTDCDDCKGCAGSTYGACELLGYCQNGARNGLICDLNQGDDQCNTITSLPDSVCANYSAGICAQKKICDNGCRKDEVCNGQAANWCSSTQCYECKSSFCNDGKTSCSNNDDAACSGSCPLSGYKNSTQPAWGPPETICPGPVRGAGAYCAILPQVSDIKVQGQDSGPVKLKTSQVVNLTFNSKVDSQQLPLVMYAIDWGDNEKTVITGIEMNDRPEASGQVHSLYHLYGYWDLKAKTNQGKLPQEACGADALGNYCQAIPKIQIRDNWGWYNKGEETNPQINIFTEKQWQQFSGTIVVREK